MYITSNSLSTVSIVISFFSFFFFLSTAEFKEECRCAVVGGRECRDSGEWGLLQRLLAGGAAPVPRKPTTVKKKHLTGNRPALCYLPNPLLTFCGRFVDYGR
jgi:hypothetical protein